MTDGTGIAFGGVTLDAVDIGSQGNAVLGIRDSGKTYTAMALAERLFDAGIPFVAFDPIGVWRFIRVPGGAKGKGYPVVVAGGEAGDLPLTPASAPMIIEAAMQNGVSVVIDLFDMRLSKADWRRIVHDCVTLLLHRNKQYGLRHIFLEEAAEFVPQKVLDGVTYAAIEKLARMGGNSRLGYTLINQRSQEVNKAVLELCENLFLHRQKGKNALENLKKWLDVSGTAGAEVMRTIPTLPQGECWAWLSGSDLPVHVKVPAKNSFHPDRRVVHNDVAAAVVKKAAVNVDNFVAKLQATLPKLEEHAKANDPKRLQAEIARLTRLIAKPGFPDELNATVGLTKHLEKVKAERDDARATLAKYRSAAADLQRRVDTAEKRIGAAVRALGCEMRPIPAPIVVKEPARAEFEKAYVETMRTPKQAPVVNGEGGIPVGCAKPLAALAGVYPSGMTEAQWATAAGYKRTGGTWGTYKSRLRAAGLIESRDGRWYALEHAVALVGEVELPPAPGPDLAEWWAARLSGTGPMARALVDAWPNWLSRDELGDRIGMTPSGGTFGTYLRRLAGANVIERGSQGVRLSEEVMGDG